jgi:hypothetical protein
MVHAALLLLMLEAVNTDLVFHHQPEAQHPKSSAIHKLPADYPIFEGEERKWGGLAAMSLNDPELE